MDNTAIKKQLKIKAGAVLRLAKENGLYTKEVETLTLKRNKFIADGAEEWDIKNAGKMIDESEKMIKDTRKRMGTAAADLRNLVVGARQKEGLAGDEDLLKAEEALEVANL